MEKPDTIYGSLSEAVHISGYTFERACGKLEWLLEDDRWKSVGGGHDDIDDFLKTIDFSAYKIAIDQRKKLSKKLTDLRATQRAAGKLLGVDHATVSRDIGANAPTINPEPAEIKAEDNEVGENAPPTPKEMSGEEVAQLAEKQVHKKIQQEKQKEKQKEIINTPAPTGKYRTIVIDPPWPIQKILRDVAPNQDVFEYKTMTVEEISSYQIPADDNCHLYLWTTQKYLPASFGIINQWGFKYIFTMAWHKNGGFQPFNLPQYNCEFVLFARRGSLDFLDTKDFFTCFSAKRREHSRKPDEFYNTVKRVSHAPMVDIFSREKRAGFDQVGNEVDKF